MMIKSLIILSLAMFAAGGIAQAAGTKAKVSGRDCKRLVQYQASADVNYKPGIDVRGRRVAGIDLAGGMKLKLPKTVEFDIAFNPLKGISATRFGETSSSVGKVKYDIGKNIFTFNGEPMKDKAIAELARKCRAAGR
jgi:hypothetical protein